jgi:hypothetical protein
MAMGGAYLEDGAVISVEGVAPAVEVCGMEKDEEDGGGVWIT